uniref:ribosomal protein S3 n=1 Tax=Pleurotus giganteus TaxID=1156456 RepID=UPI001FCCF607|nr:ribosomal protein S3 [Pleurotus giganteus]UNH92438.1 ribosomal protein S3 [Pleurotus giganteus]
MNNSDNDIQNLTKILPLFGNPIEKKIKNDRMLNKYNVNILKAAPGQLKQAKRVKDNISNQQINSKIVKVSNLLGLYLKGLNIYNFHLNNYIDNTNKKELILYLKKSSLQKNNKLQTLNSNTIVTQKDNTFNFRVSNLLNILNKYLKVLDEQLKLKNTISPSLDSILSSNSAASLYRLLKEKKERMGTVNNRRIEILKKLSILSLDTTELPGSDQSTLIKSKNNSELKKNNFSKTSGSEISKEVGIENNLTFSSLDLSQKVFIKKNINKSGKVVNKDLNKNIISNNYLKILNRTKKLIKYLNLGYEGKNYNSVFIFKNKYSKSNLAILRGINKKINNLYPSLNSKKKNLITTKHQELKIKGLNLLEIIVSSLIAIKVLNSKILIKKNKIKLIKFINLTLSKERFYNLSKSITPNLLPKALDGQGVGISDLKSTLSYPLKGKVIQEEKDNNNNNYLIPVQNKIIPVVYNFNLNPIINQYIKAMTIFNSNNKIKGSIFSFSSIIGYNFLSKNNKLIKNVYKFLYASFYSMYCLISKPVFVITPDKIIIQLFYYLFIPNLFKHKIRKIKKFKRRILNRNRYRNRNKYRNRNRNRNRNRYNKLAFFSVKANNKFRFSPFRAKFNYRKFKKTQRRIFRKLSNINLINLYPKKFKKICLILSRFFKKPVELNLIRLHYPYNDSNILVNLLGIMINKVKIRIFIRKLFRKAIIKNPNKYSNNNLTNLPAFLSGINIRIAGRLLTQKVIPRITVKTIKRGVLAKSKVNFSDVARLTKKNKRGAFSITISSGQNIN